MEDVPGWMTPATLAATSNADPEGRGPYTPCERRVAEWVIRTLRRAPGGDPIGLALAAAKMAMDERDDARAGLEAERWAVDRARGDLDAVHKALTEMKLLANACAAELAASKSKRGGAKPADTPQRKGGHARAASLSPERRSEIGKEGARARWAPR